MLKIKQEENEGHNSQVLNQILFEELLKDHPDEFNIFLILGFAPSGLTLYDLIRITNIQNADIKFGKWEEFLSKFF